MIYTVAEPMTEPKQPGDSTLTKAKVVVSVTFTGIMYGSSNVLTGGCTMPLMEYSKINGPLPVKSTTRNVSTALQAVISPESSAVEGVKTATSAKPETVPVHILLDTLSNW